MFLLQYKQITEQMHNCVIDCLRGERDDVVTNFNITMTKKDLYCLTGENWLNDKVVGMLLDCFLYFSNRPWSSTCKWLPTKDVKSPSSTEVVFQECTPCPPTSS